MAAGTPRLLWPDRVDQVLLDEVVSRIVRAVDPERIVLLGSQARGTARAGSDLDLLVVMDSPLPRHRRVVPILKALAGIMIGKDVVAYTPGEIEEWRGVREAFITSILAEGRTLYKKPAVSSSQHGLRMLVGTLLSLETPSSYPRPSPGSSVSTRSRHPKKH